MKYIFILVTATILYASPIAQTIGSKVSIVAVDGKTYSGIIKEVQGNKYKVKYEGYDFESWLTSNQFTVTDANVPTQIPQQNNAKKNNNGIYKTGDKVEVNSSDNWYSAVILAQRGNGFLIHYTAFSSSWDEVVSADKIRSKPIYESNVGVPKMVGGLPVLPGTEWKIIVSDDGRPVSVFQFRKTGRFEVISPNVVKGAVTFMGTYKVQGNTLITKNDDGKTSSSYKMTWTNQFLILNDGQVILHLKYNGSF